MSGPRIVVTREAADAAAVVDALEREGFEGWAVPTIAIAAPDDPAPLDAALADLSAFDWVVFTSPHAADVTCRSAGWLAGWPAASPVLHVAAAGPGTAARLARAGVRVTVSAEAGGAAALAAGLTSATAGALTGVRVLWPRADIAPLDLADLLTARGAHVVAPIAYRTEPVPAGDLALLTGALEHGAVQGITFFSPSSARALARALDGTLHSLAGRVTLAAIGRTTARALADLGAPPEVIAPAPTAQALAEALGRYFEHRREHV